MKCKNGFDYKKPRDCHWACYHKPKYLCCYPFGRENGYCDIEEKSKSELNE